MKINNIGTGVSSFKGLIEIEKDNFVNTDQIVCITNRNKGIYGCVNHSANNPHIETDTFFKFKFPQKANIDQVLAAFSKASAQKGAVVRINDIA